MAEKNATKKEEHLSGVIERVTFHSQDSGFGVLKAKVKGSRDLITVVGVFQQVAAGEIIQASGVWINDREYGVQFRANVVKVLPPSTVEGIEKYLSSGLITGIGPKYAELLVKKFGTQVFDVIEKHPEELIKIDGIGPKKRDKIVSSWSVQKSVREIMIFLHSHGVSTARAVRIYKTYGNDAIKNITDNPYLLARDIRGIGFKSADQIAGNLGIDRQSLIRACAGITHALQEAMNDGHCGLPREQLEEMAVKLLDIEQSIISEAIDKEIADGVVKKDEVEGQDCIFLTGLYRAEQMSAQFLKKICTGKLPWPAVDVEKEIAWVEKETGLKFPQSQRAAIEKALISKVTVITGGPGVGKTTLLNSILKILSKHKLKLALCAPTGRAAKRLGESTGLEAKTIHRLLEFNPQGGFKRCEHDLLEADLLVVDEFSMVDVPLLYSLMRAISPATAVIIVGDVDQLPSVGPGQVLEDIISSGVLPVVRLTEIFRQAAESRIVMSAHKINSGKLPELPAAKEKSDFYFIKADSPEESVDKILRVITERIPKAFRMHPTRDVQVLCPMKRGGVGAKALNIELQKALNPNNTLKVERFGTSFCLGDKVMQVENDYEKEVYNGDIGRIVALDSVEKEMIIEFDGRKVMYDFADLDSIELAYACTIHKSQGSEYPVVIIPIMMQHYMMLKRNLVYTGVTRGKKLVIIIGQWKALAMSVHSKKSEERRWSKLKDWLKL